MKALSAIAKLRQKAEDDSASLPALLLRAQEIADNVLHGEHARRKPGSGENFWQFREYMSHDSLGDIDWRKSAKSDDVFIRQKEWQVTRKTYLWCAGGKSMSFGEKLKESQNLSLALCLLLQRCYEQIGRYGETYTGRGECAIERLGHYVLERKRVRKADAALPDVKGFALPRHCVFIGVGDFLSPLNDIEKCFDALSEQTQNVVIIQVLASEELNLHFSGRVHFEGLGKDDEQIIDNVAPIREHYEARIKAHIKGVQDLCLRYGWHYQLHVCGTDMGSTLKALWERIEQGGVRK